VEQHCVWQHLSVVLPDDGGGVHQAGWVWSVADIFAICCTSARFWLPVLFVQDLTACCQHQSVWAILFFPDEQCIFKVLCV
jgi:hypothetical protein